MTFSIAARCANTGRFAIAVSSSSPAVAARCAFARAGVGAVATQNLTDPTLGPKGLDLMARGASAEEAVAELKRSAPHANYRQLTAVDTKGGTAVFSGAYTLGTAGAAQSRDAVAAGNLLANLAVPDAMITAFEASTGADLGDRMLGAMGAALEAGGEAGPVRSAGLVMVDRYPGRSSIFGSIGTSMIRSPPWRGFGSCGSHSSLPMWPARSIHRPLPPTGCLGTNKAKEPRHKLDRDADGLSSRTSALVATRLRSGSWNRYSLSMSQTTAVHDSSKSTPKPGRFATFTWALSKLRPLVGSSISP